MKKKRPTLVPGITIQDWLQCKPYAFASAYDRAYLPLCNQVFNILSKEKTWFDEGQVDREGRKKLAVMLVSYFEDFISETGLWKAFTDHNQELHGYPLPFYDLADYDPDYLNLEDFAYLIWHFMTKSLNTRIYGPDHPYTMRLAAEIYDLLEPLIEEVPVTDFYEGFLAVPDGLDYYKCKDKLYWMATKSYLMGLEISKQLDEESAGLALEENRKGTPLEGIQILLNAGMEDCMYARRCSFAAMNAPEWLSKVASCSDAKREEIRNLQFRYMGYFPYLGEDEKYYLFRYLHNDQEYKVLKNSVRTRIKPWEAGRVCYFMSVIQWEGDWWLTGTMSGWEMDEKELRKAKMQPNVSPWAYPEENQRNMRKSSDSMFRDFVAFFGSPLALFNNKKELQESMEDFFDFHNKKLSKPDPDFEYRRLKYQREFGALKESGFEDLPSGHGLGMFFIEGVGMITLSDVQNVIISLKKELLTQAEDVDLFFDLLSNVNYKVAGFLLQHFGRKNFRHPITLSKVDVWRDRHFYWRFYQPEAFGFQFPLITELEI